MALILLVAYYLGKPLRADYIAHDTLPAVDIRSVHQFLDDRQQTSIVFSDGTIIQRLSKGSRHVFEYNLYYPTIMPRYVGSSP